MEHASAKGAFGSGERMRGSGPVVVVIIAILSSSASAAVRLLRGLRSATAMGVHMEV